MSKPVCYVVDTHAWVYYLLDMLPVKADHAFKQAERGEALIYVPTIVLAECIYLVEKGRISLRYDELFSKLKVAGNFVVIPLTLEILEEIIRVPLRELHDRIIVATAKLLGAILITKDEEIRASGIIETLWE